jgi:signal transduction histidine kinase
MRLLGRRRASYPHGRAAHNDPDGIVPASPRGFGFTRFAILRTNDQSMKLHIARSKPRWKPRSRPVAHLVMAAPPSGEIDAVSKDSGQLDRAVEESTRRLAHALHDDAAQLLAAIGIAVDELERTLFSDTERQFRKVKQLLKHAEHEFRHLSHELHPTILDDCGLVEALEFLAEGLSSRGRLAVRVKGNDTERLPKPIEVAIYRVAQEALNNVLKHASATRVVVALRRSATSIRCAIRDDGVGFDVAATLASPDRRGLGLIGVRDRLASVGGTLAIRSVPGRGTELLAIVPVEGSRGYHGDARR